MDLQGYVDLVPEYCADFTLHLRRNCQDACDYSFYEQAYFIFSDIDMYYEPLDQPCIPKTWNISDDLGQIEYIFSDKTGTLTQNVMEFRRCTINGVAYGLGDTEVGTGAEARMHADNDNPAETRHPDPSDSAKLQAARTEMFEKQAQLFKNNYIGPNPTFVDPKLFDDLAGLDSASYDNVNDQATAIVHFLSALAICHTVLPERPEEGNEYNIVYKAQSPDEAALVSTARDLGFAFLGRENDTIVIEAMGERKEFTLLSVLEFNSSRKRMSIIMRPSEGGRLVLLCKGADSVIYERLAKDCGGSAELCASQKRIKEATLAHLEAFANEGLRTLCVAHRFVDEREYADWSVRYQEASSSISNRDEKIEEVCEEIEQNLMLIGGTAIEDRLQEGVPETIALLSQAGIKIWVLTGDKTETAINIGFAANLLQKNMLLIIINANGKESTQQQLQDALEKFWDGDQSGESKRHALVIDGETLKYALEKPCKDLMLELGRRCESVLCCRVSPMQKAKVVNLVKRGLNVMTLAIGDGANDVSMIQEANVGIGISGEEGRQAVMASDYAIAQFRFLGKLLLVHGRWSYLRTAEMILTFFYKNIVWTIVLFWYQIFCGYVVSRFFNLKYFQPD
ncbi:HAD-like domain-containing protein [Jimgerdemannia flammicorona]|uniref:Phospholipid-transporting ATPase n=1 Tax=Jimgerdemannia flammicorona TaxID=994334 RepID=A0A433QQE1_9FUNG|nr:HAD-like domain-containing protein [Jimgerdemannia flammicorona]